MPKIWYKKRLEEGYRCKECGAESKSEAGIKRHVGRVHEFNQHEHGEE